MIVLCWVYGSMKGQTMNNTKYNIALNHALIVINKRLNDMPGGTKESDFAIHILNAVKEDIKQLKIRGTNEQ